MAREVYFRATCSDTRVGWHLRVVGSCAALGNWDPVNGVPLVTTAQEFPEWKNTVPTRLDEAATIEYKYVICDDSGSAVRWEGTPNRSMQLSTLAQRGICPQPGVVTVADCFNTGVAPDGMRFCCQPFYVQRMSSREGQSLGIQGAAARGEAVDSFEPTMRERCPSVSMLGGPARSSSLSHFVDLAPEVTNASFEEALSTEATANVSGLVREESCSNLFFNAVDDELEVEETRIEQGFEQMYSLLGDGPLGEGTFGLVWRCKPKKGETERAAKIVKKARLHPRERNYLLGEDGEISTHLMMKHPHIVELFEYFDEQHNVTLVLEYCKGGDLFDAIIRQAQVNGRGLLENEAAVATQHTLSALAYLHRQSVVHRDIKCENILLAKTGVPLEQNVFKLCDFGFAAHDRGNGFQDRLGSPDTVAPEVVAGLCYSFPADLWSVGTIVYMMLSAESPFKGPTDMEVLRKVRAGSYSLNGAVWDNISAPPKHVITSLMIVEAKLRPTAEETLQKAWLKDLPPVMEERND